MRALGETGAEGRVYFAGGATAVLFAWRSTTVDADILLVPDSDAVLRAIPALKESLQINVELANPSQFLPELPGWAERSPFISREGRLDFCHYDLHSQALAKILRGQGNDLLDVHGMLDRGFVEPRRAWDLFESIQGQLFRYPSVDPASFRAAVARSLRS